MSLAAFGALTQIPLAASPFKRSALTPEAAAEELCRLQRQEPWDVSSRDEVLAPIDVHPADEARLRERLPLAEQQRIAREYEAFAARPRRPFVFQHSQEIEDAVVIE